MTIAFIVSRGYGISPLVQTSALSLAMPLLQRAACSEVSDRGSSITFSFPSSVAPPQTFATFQQSN